MTAPAAELVRDRRYWRVAAAGQLANLPTGMAPLAYPLLTAAVAGSYRLGSALVTVIVLVEVVLATPSGRVLDRVGVRRGLPVFLVAAAIGYALLAGLAPVASTPLLVVLAVPPAVASSGLGGGLRSMLAQTVPARTLPAALSLNATLTEIVLIVGPLLAVGLHVLGATGPVFGIAVAMALAALLLPRSGGGSTATGAAPAPSGSLLRDGRLVTWMLTVFVLGALFGTVEVGALPRAHALHGGPAAAAVLVASLSVCSVLAGIAFTVFGHRLPGGPRRRATAMLAVIGAGGVLLALGPSWPYAIAAVLVIGLCAAPVFATTSVAVQELLPERRRAEGFSLVFTAQGVGYALGSLAVAALPIDGAQLVAALGVLLAVLLPAGADQSSQRTSERLVGSVNPSER